MFTSARALPASGREAYLSAACADNEALRLEMESLLASDERARSFLESSRVVWGDAIGASSATVEREWALAKAWLYQRLSASDWTRP